MDGSGVGGGGDSFGVRPTGEWRRRSRVFGMIWLPMLLWWFALLPGGITNDSLSSWQQLKTSHWTSHHPPPFTAFVWLTSLGGTTPATTSLVETVLVAVALAWFASVITQVLHAGRWVYGVAIGLAVLPLAGPFSVMIWKDVPEAAALLALAALIVQRSPAIAPPTRRWWLAVIVASLVAGLLRWNGGATTLVVGSVVAFALPGPRRWAAAFSVAVPGLAGTGILLLLPQIAPVQPLQPIDTKAEQLADLAQWARNTPHAFTRYDRSVLKAVAPLRQWQRAGYTCTTIDPVTYNLIRNHQREAVVAVQSSALSHLWYRLAERAPAELLHARVCRASLAWSFADPPRRQIATVQLHLRYAGFGLHPLGPAAVRNAALSYAAVSDRRWVQELLWRPAVWVVLTVAAGSVGGLRRDRWRLLLSVLAVPLGVLASYAAQPAAQDARYTYAAVLVCQLAVAGYLAGWLRDRRACAGAG